ncbi:hypothetical protein VTO42DRAFT_8727 [Malbranchea cinnamomea]
MLRSRRRRRSSILVGPTRRIGESSPVKVVLEAVQNTGRDRNMWQAVKNIPTTTESESRREFFLDRARQTTGVDSARDRHDPCACSDRFCSAQTSPPTDDLPTSLALHCFEKGRRGAVSTGLPVSVDHPGQTWTRAFPPLPFDPFAPSSPIGSTDNLDSQSLRALFAVSSLVHCSDQTPVVTFRLVSIETSSSRRESSRFTAFIPAGQNDHRHSEFPTTAPECRAIPDQTLF